LFNDDLASTTSIIVALEHFSVDQRAAPLKAPG